jgi:hypothetical protein
LVTQDATFLLKSVQTSNTMILLAPQDSSSIDFQLFSTSDGNGHGYGTLTMTGSYIEVLSTAPKVARARAMLEQVLFRGFENEDRAVIESGNKATKSILSNAYALYYCQSCLGFTTADLENAVQASNEEIQQFLDDVDAIAIDGETSTSLKSASTSLTFFRADKP